VTSIEYKAARRLRGTQQGVALLLGVNWHTVQKREGGSTPITQEAALALLALPKKRKKREV
jgi:hypothetical protein